jgi:lysophospholipase L1-like esterase
LLGALLAACVLAVGVGYLGSRPALVPRIAAVDTAGPVIAFIGDSLTVGVGLPPGSRAYPELVGAELHGRVYNLGVPGITTWDAMLAEVPRVPPETTVAVVYLGTNDLMHDVVESIAPFGSRHIMRFAFVSIVNALNRKGIVTYAVLLRDLSTMPRFASRPGLPQRIAAWTDAWDEWAATRGAIPIDLRCFSDVDDVANYVGDQLHPNITGTRLLAKHVAFGIEHRGVTCPRRPAS